MRKKTPTNFTVPVYPDDLERIRSISEREGRFQKRIIRDLLDRYESSGNGAGEAGQSAGSHESNPASAPADKA